MEKLKSYSKVESNIMAKHKIVKDKVEVNKYGQMEHFMMVYGKMIWQMVKEFFINIMVGIIKVISKMISFMAMENLLLQIKTLSIKESFISINHMVLVQKYLLLKITNTREILDTTLSKAMEE